MNTLKLSLAAAAFSAIAAIAPAHAGGVCDLFGGSVGDACHSVSHVVTPALQDAVVGAGTAAGTVVGGMVGQPEIGGLVGGAAGGLVNDTFAGGGLQTMFNSGGSSAPAPAPIQRPAPVPGQIPQFGQPVGFPGPAMAQNFPPLGNVCLTPVGPAFGPPAPLGMPCMAMTPMGPAQGFITR
ncbi:MAG TPA: hypothetical protein VHA07_10210 [Devosia sp.]|nr:hypothetical protein [Devosia sp.]